MNTTHSFRRLLIVAGGVVTAVMLVGLWLQWSVAGATPAFQSEEGDDYLPVVARAEEATPTPTPTITPSAPTREPGEAYRIDFIDTIDGWRERRWRDGASWGIRHRADCEKEGRCGFLEVEVAPSDSYVLVAPMVASVPEPYRVESMGLFKGGQDGQQWGLVFAADRDTRPCPVTDFSSCFTTFYDLRLRYRDAITPDGIPYLEYRLKRVESFDAVNGPQGPSLKDWTRVDGVDARDWAKLRVEVRPTGRFRIFVNDVEMIEVQDLSFVDDQAQVGLIVANGDKGGVRVKFDYFETREK
nr:hypothetical protein [uncultured bacterium]